MERKVVCGISSMRLQTNENQGPQDGRLLSKVLGEGQPRGRISPLKPAVRPVSMFTMELVLADLLRSNHTAIQVSRTQTHLEGVHLVQLDQKADS